MEHLEIIFGIFPEWLKVTYLTLKWIFIILSICVFGAALFALKKAWRFRVKFRLPLWKPRRKKKERKKKNAFAIREWGKIQKKAQEGSPQALTIAVIESDKLIDEVLKREGYLGEFMAQRLERLGRTRSLKTLEGLWQAHRIRNNLVHTPGFQLSRSQAEEILGTYEAFLKEFGAL